MDELIEKDQNTRFSGSGASHQNGVAECGIQTVIQMSHTMLIHSDILSPQCTITAELWLMTIDHAVWLYKRMPHDDPGMYTYELWSRSSFIPRKEILSACNTWGCLAYIIEPKLHKGGYHIPKWATHSCRRVFLGFSCIHSTIMGIILNLNTWSISPQFHIVFDDMFTTIASAQNEEVVTKIWTKTITNTNSHLHVSLDEDNNPTLADELLAPEEVQEQEASCFQWIEQHHSLRLDNTSCQDWPEFTTREKPSQSLPSGPEGAP